MTDSPDDVPVAVSADAGWAGTAVSDGATPNPVEHVFDDVEASPGSPKPDPILKAGNVSRRFGGLVAVDVDYVEIQRGAITALIGPNGAGKTTFFNLLTGFDAMDSGEVVVNDQLVGAPRPEFRQRLVNVVSLGMVKPAPWPKTSYQLAKQGMVRTFQLTKALSRISVLENMKLGATDQRGESFWRALITPLWRGQERRVEARADVLLDRFDMSHMRDEYAGTMSGGQRKLIEMARALMTEPELVMLDEPMAGVNPALTQSLLGHVKELRAEGRTVIFVEHDMDVVRDISDWVVVMAEGQIIAEGTPDDIGANKTVIDAYLGAHHDQELPDKLEDQP